ncbi:MAG: CDP-glycerol glycerophosphotransferase family protein [Candidatus Hodarchaeota archaeon]
MKRILLFSGTSRESEIIYSLYHSLKLHFIPIIITLDSINMEGASEYLRSVEIPFYDILDLKVKNLVQILKVFKPSCVIHFNDHASIGKAANLAAKKAGIPSIVLLLMNLTDSRDLSSIKKLFMIKKIVKAINIHIKNYFYLIITFMSLGEWIKLFTFPIKDIAKYITRYDLRGTGNPDKILVNGEVNRILLSKSHKGISEKIKVVGDPRYDRIIKESKKLSNTISNIILIATSSCVEHGIWSPRQRKRYISQLLKGLKSFKGEYEIIFRIHPSESPLDYQKLLMENNAQSWTRIESTIPTKVLIPNAGVVISYFSTIVFEVMLLKKALVLFNPFKEVTVMPILQEPSIPQANNPHDLEKMVKALINKTQYYDKILQKYIHSVDGRSSERIINEIKTSITNSR